jgi:hypothetical protein
VGDHSKNINQVTARSELAIEFLFPGREATGCASPDLPSQAAFGAQSLTWMFASRPFARPLSPVGLLVDLLVRCRHSDLQNCHSDFRVDHRRAVEIVRPNETTARQPIAVRSKLMLATCLVR